MATFTIPVEVGNPDGQRWERIQALVDTGATHTMLPASLLERLGVGRRERWEFQVATGGSIQYDVGSTVVRIEGREWPVSVVFGDENVHVLGATALENFGFVVDPIGRRLLRVPGLAMAVP